MERPGEPRDRGPARGVATRRRRLSLAFLAAISAVAWVGGLLVGAGGEDEDPVTQEPPPCLVPGPEGLAFAAGQGIVVRMEERASPRLVRDARRGAIGGVILFPPPEVRSERLARQVSRLQEAATQGGRPPLLVAIDQEGGIVERIPALPPDSSPSEIGTSGDEELSLAEGAATGAGLRELGINLNLAPVLDVPSSPDHFMAPRAFGTEPGQVARLAGAFMRGMQSEAVAATAKHFPGLGRAPENTDLAPTSVGVSRTALERDMEPFRAAVDAGVGLVMVSSAAYPALGADGPAVLSPDVVSGVLRDELGFEGPVMSDDLLAPAVSEGRRRADVVRAASAAGTDLLLFARQPVRGVADQLQAGVARGTVSEDALRASCRRILDLKGTLAANEPL